MAARRLRIATPSWALLPFGDGAYVNVPNAGDADGERPHYGPHDERPRTVKAAYDPGNVFTFEQSVPLPTDDQVAERGRVGHDPEVRSHALRRKWG